MSRVTRPARRSHFVIGVLVVAATLAGTTLGRADDPGSRHILFTQQDAVQAFDLTTGKGYQIGTATGAIAGTTFVEFQLVPAGPPSGDALPITFQNSVIVTDVDGDQLFFDNSGSGTFHLGVPGFDFRGSGGPLTGTYVVTGGTGKYQQWKIGTTFTYRAVMTNPPSPPGGLGSVYVEVSSHDRRDWKR
jgi:hypothetical protein